MFRRAAQWAAVPARVIVLAGPSGAGKSRLAERSGLPMLRLDDFYKDAGDPSLPLIAQGPNAGVVDWDDPHSWHLDDALDAIARLCRDGVVDVPDYDISLSRRVGVRHLDLAGSPLFVAEGIFAQEVVPRVREAGQLADAICVRQHALITFWRRLTRDLREHRKPPLLLVRRGAALARAQRAVIAHAVALGCRPLGNEQARAAIETLRATSAAPRSQA